MVNSENSDLPNVNNKGGLKDPTKQDKFIKLMDQIMFHKCLVDQHEIPIFLRVPSPDNTKNYKGIMRKFSSTGFLNFNIIMQKIKTKKYNVGKNFDSELVINDINKIFEVCEKYCSYDPNSIRISRTLEGFFENQLAKLNKKIAKGAAKNIED